MTVFLVLWLAAQAVSVLAVLVFCASVGRRIPRSHEPAVAVVVAVKGYDAIFDRFAQSLFDQDYGNYRVIFAVESEGDPAVAPIAKWQQHVGGRVTLVVAGLAADEAQKNTNLLAAVRHLTPQDEILIFADADLVMDRDWIRHLVIPLVEGSADITSGFTWVVVDDRRLPTFVIASMAAGLSTFPRVPFLNAAWGGSTALRHKTFDELEVAQAWRGSFSDDLHLTRIAQRARCRIAAPPDVLPRTFARVEGFAAIARQARRWYMLARVYIPLTYALMLLGTTFLAAGWLAAIIGAAMAEPSAIVVLAAAFACSVLRDIGRGLIVWRLWRREGVAENRAFLVVDPLVAPFASIANASLAWSALLKRRTTWAGITYEVRACHDVKVLSR
jgi:ceramide glucosyltransferase